MTCSGGLFLHEEGNNNDLLLIDGRPMWPLKAIGNARASIAPALPGAFHSFDHLVSAS
jgi:hypothetical protein